MVAKIQERSADPSSSTLSSLPTSLSDSLVALIHDLSGYSANQVVNADKMKENSVDFRNKLREARGLVGRESKNVEDLFDLLTSVAQRLNKTNLLERSLFDTFSTLFSPYLAILKGGLGNVIRRRFLL